MDYGYLVENLLNEAKRGIQYQSMNKICKILLIIGFIPLIISTVLSVCGYYVLLFFYKGFSAPLEYLHQLVKKEGQEVKHATQFAIYWIAFPFIFVLYVFQAMAAVMFYFAWFGLMVNVYLVTLGGVKWQPFLMDVKFDDEVSEYDLEPGDKGVTIFTGVLMLVDLLVAIGVLTSGDDSTLLSIGLFGLFVMLCIANPIVFKMSPSVAEEEEVLEEVIE